MTAPSSFLKAITTPISPSCPKRQPIVTDDGKDLTKAVSRVAPDRLPLKDIILAAYLLDPTRTSYGLTYISETFDVSLDEGTEDDGQKLACDAAFALQVWPKAAAELDKANLMKLYDTIEEPLIHTLAVMEMNGFTVDTDRLMAMKSELSCWPMLWKKPFMTTPAKRSTSIRRNSSASSSSRNYSCPSSRRPRPAIRRTVPSSMPCGTNTL